MNVLQGAEVVLKEAGKPLHYKEITQRMLDRGLWQSEGKTPEATVSSTITTNIQKYGAHSHFQRTDEGVYALRSGGSSELHTLGELADVEDDKQQLVHSVSPIKSVSFCDASQGF
jgi:restriction system protein